LSAFFICLSASGIRPPLGVDLLEHGDVRVGELAAKRHCTRTKQDLHVAGVSQVELQLSFFGRHGEQGSFLLSDHLAQNTRVEVFADEVRVGAGVTVNAVVDAVDLFLILAGGLRKSLSLFFHLGEASFMAQFTDDVEVVIRLEQTYHARQQFQSLSRCQSDSPYPQAPISTELFEN
jgi:hypothetical protein